MSSRGQQERDAAARLQRAARRLDEARSNRDRLLRETAKQISRRRAGDIVGLTRGRVQQIINAPWTHRVTFVGELDEEAQEALSAAGYDLRVSTGGGIVAPGAELPRPSKHSVYVAASSSREAKAMVRSTLRGKGSLHNFIAEAVPSG